MRFEFRLTSKPVFKSGAATYTQDIKEVKDVLGFKQIDMVAWVYSITGTSTPTATVTIETSMQNEDPDDDLWPTLLTFTGITASNHMEKKGTATEILRYIRWKVVLTGTTPELTFDVLGIGVTE
jgi:hypothetical protein